MRFLVDTQLPRSLCAWFVDQGYEATHVRDVGLDQSKDSAIWRRAAAFSEIVLTKDEDFAFWVLQGRVGPRVIWLRTGNGSTADLIAILDPLLPVIEAKLQAGDRLVEVRR